MLLAAAAPLLAQQPETPARRPAQAPINIIADNVNRAAATAAQLLEILNKDAGLMVEFKQLVAREAGVNGQILEEGDLDEAAIAERLRSDLRARVLATALLRKYGYLVPKINPESDLAAEHNLDGQYVKLMRLIAREVERQSGRRLPINVTGAMGALASELGIPWEICRGLGLMARPIGLVAHLLEEIRRPMAGDIWRMVEDEVARGDVE